MAIKKGSIIQRRVKGLFGKVFVHTGIYIGNGRVIHFDGEGIFDKGEIREVSLEEFAGGEKIEVRRKPRDLRHANEIISKASSMKGQPRNYSFFNNNCQDFTKECYDV